MFVLLKSALAMSMVCSAPKFPGVIMGNDRVLYVDQLDYRRASSTYLMNFLSPSKVFNRQSVIHISIQRKRITAMRLLQQYIIFLLDDDFANDL